MFHPVVRFAMFALVALSVGCSFVNVPDDVQNSESSDNGGSGPEGSAGAGSGGSGSGGNGVAGSIDGGAGQGDQGAPGRFGMATVTGGGFARCPKYSVWLAVGESPGGNGEVLANEKYSFVGGVVITTQP